VLNEWMDRVPSPPRKPLRLSGTSWAVVFSVLFWLSLLAGPIAWLLS
jgi:hypothetical protein